MAEEGWIERVAGNSLPYFVHKTSGTKTWRRPTPSATEAAKSLWRRRTLQEEHEKQDSIAQREREDIQEKLWDEWRKKSDEEKAVGSADDADLPEMPGMYGFGGGAELDELLTAADEVENQGQTGSVLLAPDRGMSSSMTNVPSKWRSDHPVFNRPRPVTPTAAFEPIHKARDTYSDLIANIAVMLVGSTLALTLINMAIDSLNSSGISPSTAVGVGAVGVLAANRLKQGGMEGIPSPILQDTDDGYVVDPNTGHYREPTISENMIRIFINICKKIWNTSTAVGSGVSGQFRENIIPALEAAAETIQRRRAVYARERLEEDEDEEDDGELERFSSVNETE